MGIKNKLKENSNKLLNIASENTTKVFDYSKIKSQQLKDSINLKIREKAILATKARLVENYKTFDDYSDEQLEIIIADEERKIIDDLKTKSLVVALAALGLNFFVQENIMFKQVKSALFWYYLFKFRRRVILIILLLVIALFANAIYGDVVEYLKLKDKLEFLEVALISKWAIIIFNIVFSVYLLLSIFKKEDKEQKNIEIKKELPKKEEKFTQREKEFLYKKKLKTNADLLVEK